MNKEMTARVLWGMAFHGQNEETLDTILAVETFHAMLDKLEKSRNKGKSGWHKKDVSVDFLEEELKRHIEKGDMVDVINFAAMIYVKKAMSDIQA